MHIFLGFAPWIVFWILSGNDSFFEAILVAGIVALLLSASRFIKGKIKLLEIGSLIFFALMTVAAFAADPPWLEKWTHVLGNAALTVIALVSVLVGKPFTLQYAKEQVAPEIWEKPGFFTTNLHITLVWCACFVLQTVSSALTITWPHHETWFSWIIPTASFVAAIKFTAWYPEYRRAKYGQAPAQ